MCTESKVDIAFRKLKFKLIYIVLYPELLRSVNWNQWNLFSDNIVCHLADEMFVYSKGKHSIIICFIIYVVRNVFFLLFIIVIAND